MNPLAWLTSLVKRETGVDKLPSPQLDRRQFLKILSGSAAVAAAVPFMDLEQLVWTPGSQIVVPTLVPMLKVGDIFTIAGNYRVNPNGKPSRELQEFVVSACVDDEFRTAKGTEADLSVQYESIASPGAPRWEEHFSMRQRTLKTYAPVVRPGPA